MKKIVHILVLLIVAESFSQEYRKNWSDGQLTWDDFRALPSNEKTSSLFYTLNYASDVKVIDNVKYMGVFANAYINKSLSFVKNDFKDTFHLDYNQVIFNLLELNKRKFQLEIFNVKNIYQINSLLNDASDMLNEEVAHFQKESNYGISYDVTKKWLLKTEEELRKTSNYIIPNYRRSHWSYGMYLGVDFGAYNNPFKESLNNTLAFAMGLEGAYKKVTLGLNLSLTNSKVKKDIITNNLSIPQGDRVSIINLNATLGYPAYENEKIRVFPFIGYGVTTFGETGDKKSKEETTSASSIFGINLDFKERKKVNFTPSFLNLREEGNGFIRTRFFISNTNVNPDLKGYSINVGVAYGFEARSISIKQ
ncbi:hypothetical protein P8625_12710 [Tenacibaculum tangerinum]|uniref:Outer membrane protein beta-barrel domain-containing protein n=1 Tax=Tenacibaculum tangerinum TaxID=3038772 RepID=A0ABY8L4U3_9FLAO|nr:hypothetical protein [Tenacibaculum tangerinum]WGH74930.1 hypothetical protein P8625_12710 [Tenacibaculum tangerinum]